MTPSPSAWFQTFPARPDARYRLFCFPHAGGGITAFRAWPAQFPASVEVCAVQLPGRDNRFREAPISDIQAMVPALAEGLRPKLTGDFGFFGHSMGALIAYELARYLRRNRSAEPAHLFFSGRRAPHLELTDAPFHDLPEPQFIQTVVNRYNGIPPVILAEPELMRIFLPALRADFKLIETYRHSPEPPLTQRVTVFGGNQDHLVSEADLRAWKDLAVGPYQAHVLSGGHFFLQDRLPEISRIILQEIVASHPGAL